MTLRCSCDCPTISVRLPYDCPANALRTPCDRPAIALRSPCEVPAFDCPTFGFPTSTRIQVPISLLPSLYRLKRMDLHPSFPCRPSRSPSPLFWGLHHSWSKISMLELSGLAVVRKTGHKPTHLKHAGPKSWLYCTSDHYNQLSHG